MENARPLSAHAKDPAAPARTPLVASAARAADPVARVLALQRTIGNAAVARLLARADTAVVGDLPANEEVAVEPGAVIAEDQLLIADETHTWKAVVEGEYVEFWVHSPGWRFIGRVFAIADVYALRRDGARVAAALRGAVRPLQGFRKPRTPDDILEVKRAMDGAIAEIREIDRTYPAFKVWESFASTEAHGEHGEPVKKITINDLPAIAAEKRFRPTHRHLKGQRIYERIEEEDPDFHFFVWDIDQHQGFPCVKAFPRSCTLDQIASGRAKRSGTRRLPDLEWVAD